MEISANNLTTLFTGFDTIFQKGFEMAPSYYEKICSVVPSSSSQTLYPWLGRTTGFREWVGDRVMQALEAHAYTIVNKTFEDTVGIERERIEDDQYGVYTPVIEQLGWDARTHPDQLIFGMMKAAAQYANTTVSNTQTIQIGKLTIPAPTAYDGLSLYNTGHPTNPAGQLGALLPQWQASTAYLLNQEILDSNGNTQVVTTAGTSGSSAPSWSTTLNATTTDSGVTWTLRSKGGGLVASNVNTSGSGSYWFLVDAARPIKPFIFQKRREYAVTRMNTATDEAVFASRLFRYGVDVRCNAGVGLWQLTYASNTDLSNPGNYGDAVRALRSIKSDAGVPFGAWNGPPTTRFLVVPPSLEEVALQLLHSTFGAGSISGAVSTIPIANIYLNDATLIVSEWLA
jgi:phage major head subunit gpT-like protein